MRRKTVNLIRAVYGLPPATLVASCSVLAGLCYFVLPLIAGIPIIVAAAAVPLIEEHLAKGM